jgi:hypothetical protein
LGLLELGLEDSGGLHEIGKNDFPRFPVESSGFDQLHVVLFKENHISDRR